MGLPLKISLEMFKISTSLGYLPQYLTKNKGKDKNRIIKILLHLAQDIRYDLKHVAVYRDELDTSTII